MRKFLFLLIFTLVCSETKVIASQIEGENSVENFNINTFKEIMFQGPIEGSESTKKTSQKSNEHYEEKGILMYDEKRDQYYFKYEVDEEALEKLRKERKKIKTTDWEGYIDIPKINIIRNKKKRKRSKNNNENDITNSKLNVKKVKHVNNPHNLDNNQLNEVNRPVTIPYIPSQAPNYPTIHKPSLIGEQEEVGNAMQFLILHLLFLCHTFGYL